MKPRQVGQHSIKVSEVVKYIAMKEKKSINAYVGSTD